MTGGQKATQDEYGTPFDVASCVEMMERLMAQQGERCGCAEMMSGNCVEMMETCCVTQREVEK